jgi:hypothetical protein
MGADMGNAIVNSKRDDPGLSLRMLDLQQIKQIDEMLASIGEYGELHLVVQHGELRYINRLESHKAWRPDGGHKTER